MSQLKMQSNDNNKNIANDDNHRHHHNNNNNNSNTNDLGNNEITTMGQNVATLKPSSTPTTETLTTAAVTPTTPSLIVTNTIPATELKSSSVNDINKNPVTNQSNAHNRSQKNANTDIPHHSNSKSTSCVNTTSITVINPFTNVINITTSSSASVINRTNNNLNSNHSDININKQSFTKAKCVPQATTSMVSSLSSSAMATTRADTINTMAPAMHWSQSECCHLGLSNHQAVPRPPERRVTAYERLTIDLETNPKSLRELSLGKRIGLYRIRGELGSGNFSSVKLGIHTLVKGKWFLLFNLSSFYCKHFSVLLS